MKAVLAVIFILSLSLCAQEEENKVLMGPGFEKNQQSSVLLEYDMPEGWISDDNAKEKLGIHAILVPQGKSITDTDRLITIAFQLKNPLVPGLDNLENFFRVDMQNSLREYPDFQAERWQPSALNPDMIPFMSMEIYGTESDNPSPHLFIILDSGDGFYSVTAGASSREELGDSVFTNFFNSLGLLAKNNGDVRFSMILVNKKKQAKQIIKDIKGGVSFVELAKAFSIGPGKASGGDLGVMSPDDLMKDIKKVALKLNVGDISDIVKIGKNYAVLKRTM